MIVAAVRDAITDGELALADSAVPAPGSVPLRSTHGGGSNDAASGATDLGDYATALPLRLAAAAGRPAGKVAAVLAKRLAQAPGVRAAGVTGPGVLTVSLRAPGALAAAIVAAGESYARAQIPRPSAPVWPARPMTFDNPGFLVRFAHVRAVATARHSADLGIARGPLDPELLDTARERLLLGRLGELPRWADLAARRRDPQVFARHLVRVADAYHEVYEHCPALPRGDQLVSARQHARLWLAAAVQVALASGLRTLGETPPERL